MKKLTQRGFSTLEVVIMLILLGLICGTGWLVYSKNKSAKTNTSKAVSNFKECVEAGNPVMESYPEQCSANGQTFTNEEQLLNNGWNTEVTSGRGAFSVRFPDGWGDVFREVNGDRFVIAGKKQPEHILGKPVKMRDIDSYGTDSPSLFTVMIHDNFAPPQGIASDFIIGKAEDELRGKKYVYEYPQDTEIGIGYLRVKGDRDYEYVFSVGGGKQLRVYYHVYASDPRNNIETVDEIVRSIRLHK